MGWLWSSTPSGNSAPAEAKTKANDERSFALTEEQRQRIFGKPSSAPSAGGAASQSDKEIEAFLNSFDGAPKPSSDTPSTTTTTDTDTSTPTPSRTNPDGSLSIAPDHLYPRTMSCRQAFDQAFYCQSLGGKFNDIYRFGALQSCSEQWDAFWFCMRHRTLPSANKEEIIADWYRERERRKKAAYGSSEDVWVLRERAVEKAFGRDPAVEGQVVE